MSRDWNLADLADYPFLDDAKRYIRENGPEPDKLLVGWGEMKNRAQERVLQSLKDGKVANRALSDEIMMEDELFSYPVARMLVSCIADNYLIRRYALGEAERIAERLRNEETEVILEIGEELGIPAVPKDEDILLYFVDYLENTVNLKVSQWKLINQDLRNGWVLLPISRYVRILKERIMLDIVRELPITVTDPDLLAHFSEHINKIRSALDEFRADTDRLDMGRVEPSLFPPCIRQLIVEIKEGVNLSHDARFALTAFLHKSGLGKDEIVSVFRESPDFREDLALYQIEHIIGEISGTEYTPPGCDHMATTGLCYKPDELCNRDWMTHPLTYYSTKKRAESD